MRSIGLIAAMPEECRPLLRQVEDWKAGQLGLFNIFRFRLDGCDCQLVQSGIGMKRAGDAARAMLAEIRPEVLVSFGVAGAVKAGLQIGDVVALHSVSQLDQGIPGLPVPLATFSARAQETIELSLRQRGVRFAWGTALTTRGSQFVQMESLLLENPVLEMETYAIARAAAESGVPLFALRGVSDNPEAPLPFDLGVVMTEDSRPRIGRLIQILLRNPKIIYQINRLRQNTVLAAENTAVAVIAALRESSLV